MKKRLYAVMMMTMCSVAMQPALATDTVCGSTTTCIGNGGGTGNGGSTSGSSTTNNFGDTSSNPFEMVAPPSDSVAFDSSQYTPDPSALNIDATKVESFRNATALKADLTQQKDGGIASTMIGFSNSAGTTSANNSMGSTNNIKAFGAATVNPQMAIAAMTASSGVEDNISTLLTYQGNNVTNTNFDTRTYGVSSIGQNKTTYEMPDSNKTSARAIMDRFSFQK